MGVGSVNGSAGRASENETSRCLVTGARDGDGVGVGVGVGEGVGDGVDESNGV